jgi:hypothetical protein
MRSWYATIAALALAALVGQIALVIGHHRSVVNFFSYFTVESNILVLAMSALIAIHPTGDGRTWRILRLGALTGITVTGVVYGTVIAPYVHPRGAELVYNAIFHYVVPAMAVLGFLALGPRRAITRADLAFMAWPAAWLAYTMIRGAVSHPGYLREDGTRSRYPYGFLDVELHGWGTVGPTILGVAVLLVGVACAYIWASGQLAQPRAAT